MNISFTFYNPITCGLAMALSNYCILKFWYPILTHRRKIHPNFMIVLSVLNGLMSGLAELFTANNASPRTIALYMPFMVIIQILIFGHIGLWGTIMCLVLTSFQFITLYSAAVGIVSLIAPIDLLYTREGLVIPVTIMNIGMFIFLFSMLIYRKIDSRDEILSMIISTPKQSMILMIYCTINSVAVTLLAYVAMDIVMNPDMLGIASNNTSINMIVRDLILFFSTIMMLDIQTKNLRNEMKAAEIAEKNKKLEKTLEYHNYHHEQLKRENAALQADIERERTIRKNLRRNSIFSVTANITRNLIIESDQMSEENRLDKNSDKYSYMYKQFVASSVHPDYQELVNEQMSVERLLSLAESEVGFELSFLLSPKAFANNTSDSIQSSKISSYMNRDYIWASLECVLQLEDDGIYAYFYVLDVDEKMQEEEAIRKAASTDALTGLLNRRALEYNFKEYRKNEASYGTLFMFDLDFFKSVNDKLGHPAGDALLIKVSEILKNSFRPTDFICRIGGDEFCVFAKEFTDINTIRTKADSLNDAGRMIFTTDDGEDIKVSFSIGIALLTENTSEEDLYAKADQALYKAKENGRNCYWIAE